jgi:hypothetical protein
MPATEVSSQIGVLALDAQSLLSSQPVHAPEMSQTISPGQFPEHFSHT